MLNPRIISSVCSKVYQSPGHINLGPPSITSTSANQNAGLDLNFNNAMGSWAASSSSTNNTGTTPTVTLNPQVAQPSSMGHNLVMHGSNTTLMRNLPQQNYNTADTVVANQGSPSTTGAGHVATLTASTPLVPKNVFVGDPQNAGGFLIGSPPALDHGLPSPIISPDATAKATAIGQNTITEPSWVPQQWGGDAAAPPASMETASVLSTSLDTQKSTTLTANSLRQHEKREKAVSSNKKTEVMLSVRNSAPMFDGSNFFT